MKFLKVWLACLLMLLVSPLQAQNNQPTELLPEVQSILVLPPFDEAWLENNLYVDLAMLLYVPDDYHAEGKKLVRENYELMQEWLTTDRKISPTELSPSIIGVRETEGMHLSTAKKNDPRWKMISERPAYLIKSFNSDWESGANDDIANTRFELNILKSIVRNNKEDDEYESDEEAVRYTNGTINQVMRLNHAIVKRYDEIFKEGMRYQVVPSYATQFTELFLQTISGGTSLATPLVDFSLKAESFDYRRLSTMMQTKGLHLIAEGHIQEGLDRLYYDYLINQTLVTGEGIHLRYNEFTLFQLYYTYRIMTKLLVDDLLNDYLDHPLVQAVAQPIFTEASLKAYISAYLPRMTDQIIRENYLVLMKDRHRQDGIRYPWGYYAIKDLDVNSTLNLLYLYYQMVQEHYENTGAFMPLTESDYTSEYKTALTKWQQKHTPLSVKEDWARLTNEVRGAEDFQGALYAYHSAINYQRLVAVQLAVKKRLLTMAESEVVEEIPEILKELESSINHDTFTQKLFIYDPDHQWITMDARHSTKGLRYDYEEHLSNYTARLTPKKVAE